MPDATPTNRRVPLWAHPRFQWVTGLLAVLAFAVLHQVYLQRAKPDALYMDSLRLLAQLDQWQAGTLSTLDFWGQGSSHRGFVNQLFLIGNVTLFDLDVLLVNRLTGLVIAAVALLLILAWCRDSRSTSGSRADALATAGVSVVIAGLCYSWAGFELFTLDLGLPLWVKNLTFVAFFAAHACLIAGGAKRPFVWSAVLAALAPLVVLVVGMGWNYAFIGAVIALQFAAFLPAWRTSGRWQGVLPCVSLLAAFAVYLESGTVTDAAVRSDMAVVSVQTPLITLYALGSTIGNPAAISLRFPLWIIAVAGAGILLTGVLASVSWLRRGGAGSRLPLYLIAYGALVAVSVTFARGQDGPGGVMASRYYMDLVLGLIGVVWITVRELRHIGNRTAAAVLVWSMLTAITLLHAWTNYYEWRASPYRALAFADMNRALLKSVPDDNAAALLQSPLAHARSGVEVMRERHLSVFAGHPELQCSGKDIVYGDGWHAQEAHGRWSQPVAEISLPTSCVCDFAADLYIPDVFNARRIEVRHNGKLTVETILAPGHTTTVELGKAGGTSRVTLSAHSDAEATSAPAGTADEPDLGVLLSGMSVRCAMPD